MSAEFRQRKIETQEGVKGVRGEIRGEVGEERKRGKRKGGGETI